MKAFIAWRGHRFVALPVRVYLGGVFLLACYHKLLDPRSFAVDVATYQLLPLASVNSFALVLPWVELLAGVMLVVGLRVRAASLLTTGMMVAFMLALGWALHLGLDMSCGCFASQAAAKGDTISWHTMLRDGSWLVLSVYVLLFDRRPIGLEMLASSRRSQ
jgi:putative oxidoreductase